MSSDLSDGNNSSESYMAFEEFVSGHRVGVVLHAGARPNLVCIDTGCNRIILIDNHDIDDYKVAIDAFLRTVQAEALLVREGHGRIGENAVLHIPGATANLLSTHSIVINQCQIILGYDEDDKVFWREIECLKGRQAGMDVKTIEATNFNNILLRQGFTIADEEILKKK